MPEKIQSVYLDANESAFFARELEFIKSRSYDILYPEFKALRLIPVSTEAGPGAEVITYEQYDSVGIMKIISNYADDLPRSDIKGKQFSVAVKSLGGSYGYNLQEIRAARMAGKPLEQRKANACRRANDQAVENIGWLARPADGVNGGLCGLLYNPNVTSATAVAGAVSTYVKWIDDSSPTHVKTAAEIVNDMVTCITDVIDLTKGVEVPDTLLLPTRHYSLIANKRMETGTDTTILEFFKRNNPGVTVEWLNQLKDVAPLPSGGAGPSNCMIAYKKSPDKLTLEIPQAFEQLPIEQRGLEFIVNCHSRIGGVIIYYPLSVNIKEGI